MTITRLVTECLIDGLRRGDERAIAELFRRYYEALLRRTQRRISPQMQSKFGAEDILQSAFRTFWERARKGRFEISSSDNIMALLVCISQKKLLKKLEWWNAEKRRGEVSIDELKEILDSNTMSPEEVAAFEEVIQCARTKLPEGARPVLELLLQGYTSGEIEREVKVSNYQVRLVRKALLECLESSLQTYLHTS